MLTCATVKNCTSFLKHASFWVALPLFLLLNITIHIQRSVLRFGNAMNTNWYPLPFFIISIHPSIHPSVRPFSTNYLGRRQQTKKSCPYLPLSNCCLQLFCEGYQCVHKPAAEGQTAKASAFHCHIIHNAPDPYDFICNGGPTEGQIHVAPTALAPGPWLSYLLLTKLVPIPNVSFEGHLVCPWPGKNLSW